MIPPENLMKSIYLCIKLNNAMMQEMAKFNRQKKKLSRRENDMVKYIVQCCMTRYTSTGVIKILASLFTTFDFS